MELRHLRYFVAVADAGNLTVAAPQMLHTSQPSLSRQIRDLEDEVGTPLLTRRARGVDLTPAGRAFLDHARSALSQVEAAGEAARRVAGPAKPCFTMGFLTGHELTWMPDPTGRSRLAFARYKGQAEKALLAAGFPRVYLYRPAYIYPVQPRKEPNFSYRLLRAVYPVFRLLFPNQVIRADELAWAMVDVVLRQTQERQGLVFENRDIRAMVESLHPPAQ
jgi:hypothetical protein